MIEISEERYQVLLTSWRILNTLYAVGVDSWEGYDRGIALLSAIAEKEKELNRLNKKEATE